MGSFYTNFIYDPSIVEQVLVHLVLNIPNTPSLMESITLALCVRELASLL